MMLGGMDTEVFLECSSFACAVCIALYAVVVYLCPMLRSMADAVLQQQERDEAVVLQERVKRDVYASEVEAVKAEYAQWSVKYSGAEVARQEILEELLVLPTRKVDRSALQYAAVLTALEEVVITSALPPTTDDLDAVYNCL